MLESHIFGVHLGFEFSLCHVSLQRFAFAQRPVRTPALAVPLRSVPDTCAGTICHTAPAPVR